LYSYFTCVYILDVCVFVKSIKSTIQIMSSSISPLNSDTLKKEKQTSFLEALGYKLTSKDCVNRFHSLIAII